MLAVLAALGLFLTPFKATLSAPTHHPKVNARWSYSVRVVGPAGKPLRARLTAQVVDPFGGTHPVEVGTSTKDIVRLPFKGTFRDFVQWPPESRGFRLTFRVAVMSAGRTVELTYWVRPR
jgi:hypothetical protein